MRVILTAVASVVVALVVTGAAVSAPAKTVTGSVGPGFTISMKLPKLKAGVPYRFVISDRASVHDFHLTGPGVDKVITGVGFTGTKSVVLTLKKGTYRYVCDPHSAEMNGSFKVA